MAIVTRESKAVGRPRKVGAITGFLYSSPSLLSGMASVFDLGGVFTKYNVSPSAEEADCWAIYKDWAAVGSDLWTVVRTEGEKTQNGAKSP